MNEVEIKTVTESRASAVRAGEGVPDPNNDYPIVRLIHETAGQLGCGVLLADDWVLTVSHCIAGRIPHFEVELAGPNPSRVVARSVHWQSGASYDFQDEWPNGVEDLTKTKDELVLVRIWGHLKHPKGPALFGSTPPDAGSVVLVPTLGQSKSGHYLDDSIVITAQQVCFCDSSDYRGRGAVLPINNGSFLPDDSGSPVFHITPDKTAVVGVLASLGPISNCCKSGSNHPLTTEIGYYLPITENVVTWIKGYIGQNQLSPPTRGVLKDCFTVRRARTYPTICHLFENQEDLDTIGKKVWYLDVVPKPNLLHQCDIVKLKTEKDGFTTLTVETKNFGTSICAKLNIGKKCARGIYYLSGTGNFVKTGEDLRLYVYAFRDRIDECGELRRGIRVEAFRVPTNFKEPDDTVPDCTDVGNWNNCPLVPLPIIRQCQFLKDKLIESNRDLQDDDGNGFEDPL